MSTAQMRCRLEVIPSVVGMTSIDGRLPQVSVLVLIGRRVVHPTSVMAGVDTASVGRTTCKAGL